MHIGGVHNHKSSGRMDISNHQAIVHVISVERDHTELLQIALSTDSTSVILE